MGVVFGLMNTTPFYGGGREKFLRFFVHALHLPDKAVPQMCIPSAFLPGR